jgi:hypothetical protein
VNKEEAARLTRRALTLRAKAVYVSDTGESVPLAEKRALESKAKELEERVHTEYQPVTAKRPDWTTERSNWSDRVYHQEHYPSAPGQPDKSWVYTHGEDYLSAYFSGTAPEEDIVEEGYRYDPDGYDDYGEGDY